MADCPSTALCPFFNDKMASTPSVARIFKKKYCAGDFETCARKVVAAKVGRENVPGDLFPNQADRASKFLKGS